MTAKFLPGPSLLNRRGVTEINIECPAITPTLGSELLSNGGFEAPYNTTGTLSIANGWINSNMVDGVDSAAEETTIVHAGTSSQRVTAAQNKGVTSAALISLGKWYHLGYYLYGTGAGSVAVLDSAATSYVRTHTNPPASWSNFFATFRGKSASDRRVSIVCGTGGYDWYNDGFSLKEITNMTTYLGDFPPANGTYQCTPTVEAYTCAGMYIRYLNATNFVALYIDRVTGTAKLVKCIAGTWTEVISGSITYGAEDILKCIVDGTNYSLYYNGVQVGTTQTISDTLGTAVYGFSTYAANTVGEVTVNRNLS